MAAREKIDEMVRRIVERFDPEKIILFGSHASGAAGPQSDADLLVIMPVQGSRRKQATEIDCALVEVDLPADIIVATPEEVQRDGNRVGTVMYPALRDGKVLYERRA